jgi:ADP-ribose pyrophosphatase YjhB (NUDIX family)
VKARVTGRVLLISPAGRLALMRVPGFDDGMVWVTFGGRLEPGESVREGALREMAEETGRDDLILGEPIFLRDEVRVIDGEETRLTETFFVARAPDETLSFEGWTPEERAKVDAVRWWSLADLAASDETFLPRQIAQLMEKALQEPPMQENGA